MIVPMVCSVAFEVPAIVEALERDGYVVVPDVVDRATVDATRADLDRVLAATPTGRNGFEGYVTKRVYRLFAKTRSFDRWAIDPVVLGVLDRTLGDYQLSAPAAIQIGPGEPAQTFHQDDQVYPLPVPHAEVVVNTMWAFDDFTAANGGTRFVPGSHRWEPGRRPTDDDPVEQLVMPAGSVAFYLGSVFHGGGANQTDRPRLGVILEYVSGWLRPQENHVIGVPPALVATLPQRLQELLGYSVAPPFLGYVDGHHPRRFLPEPSGPAPSGSAG